MPRLVCYRPRKTLYQKDRDCTGSKLAHTEKGSGIHFELAMELWSILLNHHLHVLAQIGSCCCIVAQDGQESWPGFRGPAKRHF